MKYLPAMVMLMLISASHASMSLRDRGDVISGKGIISAPPPANPTHQRSHRVSPPQHRAEPPQPKSIWQAIKDTTGPGHR